MLITRLDVVSPARPGLLQHDIILGKGFKVLYNPRTPNVSPTDKAALSLMADRGHGDNDLRTTGLGSAMELYSDP